MLLQTDYSVDEKGISAGKFDEVKLPSVGILLPVNAG
ncbi:hypothetical protein SAMN04488574_10594 [Bacillus sp. 71mf]|nr:hypothetical protein SAMN04488574_10594 [Bacillus sp. 71mf]SFS66011.1 hypothetical protein SAMN04488145_102224 [Bacillus sp. 103mf]